MTPRCPLCGQSPDAPSLFEIACAECMAEVEPLTDEELQDALYEAQCDVESLGDYWWPWGDG